MKEPKSKFPTMGTSAGTTARNSSGQDTTGKLVKKKNTQSGDPYAQPMGKKSTTRAGGRAYGITASMPSYKDPSAGMTQGNGRLFTSAVNRTAPNFQAGYQHLD